MNIWPTTKLNIRPTKVENVINKNWTSDLQKLNIRPTKFEHPTYKSWILDLQKLIIPPTKVEHPTYKSWTSHLRKLNIRPTKVEHPTYRKSTNAIIHYIGYKGKIFPYHLLYLQLPTDNCRSDVRDKLIIGPTVFVGQKVRRSES